jgi:hypothetical protein
VAVTRELLVLPKTFRTRTACLFSASIERSSGVFLSRASPVYEQNALGMYSVMFLPFSLTNTGEVQSHAV